MKFYHLLFLLIFTCQIESFAQTKIIAHKSHGGMTHNFKVAMQNDIFDLNDSNFGEPANPIILYTIDTINIL